MGSNPTLSAQRPGVDRPRQNGQTARCVSVTLFGMSQTPNDPAGTTHQFQNFANQAQSQKSGPNVALIAGVAAAVVIVAVIVIALMMM